MTKRIGSKRLIRCYLCDNPCRRNYSYKARVEEVQVNPLTGERKLIEIETRICRECAQKSGYKVKPISNNKSDSRGA